MAKKIVDITEKLNFDEKQAHAVQLSVLWADH